MLLNNCNHFHVFIILLSQNETECRSIEAAKCMDSSIRSNQTKYPLLPVHISEHWAPVTLLLVCQVFFLHFTCQWF